MVRRLGTPRTITPARNPTGPSLGTTRVIRGGSYLCHASRCRRSSSRAPTWVRFELIESQFRHLMRVAASVREGAISSSRLLKRLRSGARKNATYAAFREVGLLIRAVQLLRYLSDAPLRRRVTAATNKVEAFNRFSQWIGFGNRGVIAYNDPIEQEKAMKFNALLTNTVMFHNALDIAEIVRPLLEEGWEIDPEDLAHISPYLTEHIAARPVPGHRRLQPGRLSLGLAGPGSGGEMQFLRSRLESRLSQFSQGRSDGCDCWLSAPGCLASAVGCGCG
ncbi:Tn3 family transposase [Streptomyces sp. NPDC059349]|uniref:Tn3 family transposase n=1 Tax=Streptomyces sp. NPDC059349 TaxID=3346808 RepID=UPI0036CB2AAC